MEPASVAPFDEGCLCVSLAEGKFRHLESSKGVVGIETRKDKDT